VDGEAPGHRRRSNDPDRPVGSGANVVGSAGSLNVRIVEGPDSKPVILGQSAVLRPRGQERKHHSPRHFPEPHDSRVTEADGVTQFVENDAL